uniref:J domain-containing protein n=1 Tax=Trichobilharzia regenti TaxID=157069 RepID=A0AA85JBI2_TRIRE|nr:unnamed protein product [Trichobilharzia regenti]
MFLLCKQNNNSIYYKLFIIHRYYSNRLTCKAAEAFELLGIPTSSTPEDCRQAYLKLARSNKQKCSHNNQNNDELQEVATAEFQRLHEAYTIAYEICQHNQKLNNNNFLQEDDELNNDIERFQYKAPQHRRYLDLGRQEQHVEGGNLSERRRFIQSQRIARALQGAADCRIKKIMESVNYDDGDAKTGPGDCNRLISKGRRVSSKHRELNKSTSISYFERVAEEHIQNAIERGEFNNLSGQGRPLDYNKNVHVFGDSTVTRVNQLLANQGFLPKWVLLNKEINSRWSIAFNKLKSIYNTEGNVNSSAWLKAFQDFEAEVKELNQLLDQYNLIVPSHHVQRFHFNTKSTIEQLMTAENSQETEEKDNPTNDQNENDPPPKSDNDKKSLWDPRFMAEVMSDFYRELVKAYVSIIRGFKDHK